MNTFIIEQTSLEEVKNIINELVSSGTITPTVGIIDPTGYKSVLALENLADPTKSEHAYFIGKLDGDFISLAAMAKYVDPVSKKTKILHRMHYVRENLHTKNIGHAMMRHKADYCVENNWNDDDDTVHFSYLLMGYADDFLSIIGWDPYTIEAYGNNTFIGYTSAWREYKEIPRVTVEV